MTDQEAHDALAKMAQEHARGAVPVDGEPQDFPEPEKTIQVDVPAEYGRGPQKLPAVDLTPEARDSLTIGEPKRIANPTMEMPEMDLTDSKTAAAPFTVNGEVGKLATGAAVPPKLRLDLSQPIGAPSSRRPDTELAGLQDDAKRRRQTGQLGQAVTDSIERPSNFLDYAQRLGGGGVSAPAKKSTLWQDYEEEGGRAISELEQRRKADGAMAAKDEAQDPNSATAKIYRAALLKFAPDLQLDTATPAQMVQIAPWLESYAKENSTTIKSQASAAAKAKEEADKKSQHETERSEDFSFKEQTHRDAQDNAAAMRALAGSRMESEQGARDQAGAQHLGDKAAETQSALKALDEIDATIAKNPGDIPGIGRGKSMLPDAVQSLILSDEGLSTRNNAKDVLSTVLHKRSGAAVSPSELARYEQMYGLNGGPQQFAEGMKRLRRDFTVELQAEQAGVSPGARQKFQEGGGRLVGGEAGLVKMRFPNGNVADVPAHDVEEARSHGGIPQ